ncbi:MAG: hypothetical protein MI810_11390, partial [Flavobacteriales bacterium]|nr:hypothetical protein [Flavobacteriales bacterium]
MKRTIHSFLRGVFVFHSKGAMLLIFMTLSYQNIAQTFINGSFEDHAETITLINPTAPVFNASLANCFGFHDVAAGAWFNTDLWNGGSADGDWHICLTPADAVSIELDLPLVSGGTYILSFWDSHSGGWPANDIELYATEDPADFGIPIALVPGPAPGDVWQNNTITFVAPNNATHIVVGHSGAGGYEWVWVDDFEILCQPLVTSVSTTEICLGEEITLSATSTTGGTVTWDGGATNGVPFTPTSSGTITYTATSTSSPTDCPFAIDILVHETPTIDGGADLEVCEGETVTLTGSGAGAGGTYTWDGGVTDGVAFTPGLGTTTYTVTGTTASGCENTATVDVTVNPLPVIDAGADVTLCLGDELTLTGSGAGAGGTYTWDGGVTDGVTFTPGLGTTTYTVTGTTASGCENTATVDVTVNPLPTVTAIADETVICEDETVTLTGS